MTDWFQMDYFHVIHEIVPFVEQHWFHVWNREKPTSTTRMIGMCLSKYANRQCFTKHPTLLGYWGLNSFGCLVFIATLECIPDLDT